MMDTSTKIPDTRYQIPDTLLRTAFALLLATLLIGQRFGFAWAGGNGYVRNLDVSVEEVTGTAYADRLGERRPLAVGDRLRRGESVITEAGCFAKIVLQDDSQSVTIAMDERTNLTVDAATVERVGLYLHAGRIESVNDGTIETFDVRTNFTKTTIGPGRASFVNYDFSETIAIIPLSSTLTLTTTKNDETTVVSSPINAHETNPVSVTPAAFNPQAGGSARFYEWVGREMKGIEANTGE